jgi:hypothetical protein
MVLFGGYLIWFCHDYLTTWFGHDFAGAVAPYTPDVIAKSAFFHCAFIFSAVAGLLLPPSRRLARLIASPPEPNNTGLYFVVVVACFLVGISPFFLFTANPWYEAIWRSVIGGRGGEGAAWTTGRTGNVNLNWGGYIVHLLQIGQVGAQLGVFYALLVTRNVAARAFCWAYFAFEVALAFGTGTRGEIAFMILPVLCLLFLKYQVYAALALRRVSLKSYLVAAPVAMLILVAFQIQITYRNRGFVDIDMERVDVTGIEGNTMFSEGLRAWGMIPEFKGFLANRFAGEGLVRALPETAWRFLISPIPRALWTTKPIDPLWSWHNALVTGRDESMTEGTTVSTGLVGDWYFRYGMLGLIQGGLLFGWLARAFERAVHLSIGRPLALILALGMLVWLFRCYRNFTFIHMHPLLIGVVFLVLCVKFSNLFTERPADAAGGEARAGDAGAAMPQPGW